MSVQVMGQRSQEGTSLRAAYVCHHSSISNQELHYLLRKAGASIQVLPDSTENQRACVALERTTKKIGVEFVTVLQWKEDAPLLWKLADGTAVSRMGTSQKRLSQTPSLKQNIDNHI